MGKNRKQSYRVIPGDGDPCPRCRRPMQIREHIELREKQLNAAYYFSRWFYCTHSDCKVTLHMAERFKVHRQDRVEWGG